ncbi:MAG: hypothetical protein QM582_15165 [Micropruina sp.]|uniref:hypothetical protein n=1 Tax=Micropruina sp. TaxID=2737536 RepID=UPI0039E5D8F0
MAMSPSPEHIAARRVLLDALTLMQDQLDALVLVGAQAVYHHAPLGDPRPTYTTDGDLVIDPDLLGERPDLGATLTAAGFTLDRHGNPGHWISPDGVVIDLMVPAGSLSASTRRTARLPGQTPSTARRTDGLEVALVDNARAELAALEPSDHRRITLKVAGPAALVVAKACKMRERVHLGKPDRISSKDAGDLLRLMRNVPPAVIGTRLATLANVSTARAQIVDVVDWLDGQASTRNSDLLRLAVDDLRTVEPAARVRVATTTLLRRLTDAYRAVR